MTKYLCSDICNLIMEFVPTHHSMMIGLFEKSYPELSLMVCPDFIEMILYANDECIPVRVELNVLFLCTNKGLNDLRKNRGLCPITKYKYPIRDTYHKKQYYVVVEHNNIAPSVLNILKL